MPGGAEGPGKKRGAGVKHHRGGKDEQDKGHGAVAEAGGLRHRGNHGEPHRQAQDQGQEEAPAKFFDLRFRGAGGPLLPGRPFHFVARVSNHFLEGGGVGEAGIKLYLGLAGGQVDGGQLHPGGGRQGPVHPGDAGGAVHAPHGEGDFFSRGENGLISLGAGHQQMDLKLLIYIDTPRAKGKGRGQGDGHALLPGAVPVSRRSGD